MYNKIRININALIIALFLLVASAVTFVIIGSTWGLRTVIPQPKIVNVTADEELAKIVKFQVSALFGNIVEEVEALETEITQIENSNNKLIISVRAEYNGSSLTIVFDFNIDTDAEKTIREKYGHYFNAWNEIEPKRNIVEANGGANAYYEYSADWQKKEFVLQFDSQGGSQIANLSVTFGQTLFLEKATFGNHIFMGWTSEIASFSTNAFGEIYIFDLGSHNEVIAMTAQWERQYIVVLDMQKGSGGSSNLKLKFNDDIPTNLTAPTRSGYIFGGYFAEQNGVGEQYFDEIMTPLVTRWTKNEDATLYAKWTPNTYTVVLDPNGGSGGTSSVKATYGEKLPESELIVKPYKDAYTFVGYFDALEGGSEYYFSNMTSDRIWFKDENNVTLFARWSENETYHIRYLANKPAEASSNLKGYMADSERRKSENTQLSANNYQLFGWNFVGWNTVSDGSGTQYADSAVVSDIRETIVSMVCLYAQWEANTYTVTYDYMGATSDNSTGKIVLTYDALFSLATPKRSGYAFVGWEDDGGNLLTNNQGISTSVWLKANNVVLFAKWNAIEYAITYAYEGATGNNSPLAATTTFDQSYTLIVPEKIGKTFIGWFKYSEGKGSCYTDWKGASIDNWMETNDIMLYAYYETVLLFNYEDATANVELEYKIIYDGVQVGDLTNSQGKGPQKTGYVFNGWWTEPMGGGVQYDRSTLGGNVSINIYAKWVMIIEFNYQGATTENTELSRAVTYKTKIGSLSLPSKPGNTFEGWYTEPEGLGNRYYDTTELRADGLIKLYAKWKKTITPANQNFVEDNIMPVDHGIMVNCNGKLPEITSGDYAAIYSYIYVNSFNTKETKYLDK